MRKFLLALFVASVLFAGLASPQYVRADALCYVNSVPTPIPTTGKITLGICVNGVLQTNATGVATPIPFPTFPWPVVQPTAQATPATMYTAAASATSVLVFPGVAGTKSLTICASVNVDTYFALAATATYGAPYWQHFPAATDAPTVVAPCFTIYGYAGPVAAISGTSPTGLYNITRVGSP